MFEVVNKTARVSETVEAGRAWRKHTRGVKDKYNIVDITAKSPYTSRPEVKLLGMPRTDRFLDAVNTYWGIKLIKAVAANKGYSSSDLRSGLWLDVSQSIHRTASHLGGPGVLTTSSLPYSFEFDTVIDGEDMLSIQGFPKSVSMDDDFSSFEKHQLAGESFHLGVVGVESYALYLNPWAPWWQKQK